MRHKYQGFSPDYATISATSFPGSDPGNEVAISIAEGCFCFLTIQFYACQISKIFDYLQGMFDRSQVSTEQARSQGPLSSSFLGERSETAHFLLWFQQKAALVFVEEKRVHNTSRQHAAKLQLFLFSSICDWLFLTFYFVCSLSLGFRQLTCQDDIRTTFEQ